MADTQKRSSELKILTQFTDGDTRTITLKNPKNDITTTEIVNLQNLILNGGTSTLLIGDKTGAAFNAIMEVKKVNKTETTLDINS